VSDETEILISDRLEFMNSQVDENEDSDQEEEGDAENHMGSPHDHPTHQVPEFPSFFISSPHFPRPNDECRIP
jgi:hypothetical protein